MSSYRVFLIFTNESVITNSATFSPRLLSRGLDFFPWRNPVFIEVKEWMSSLNIFFPGGGAGGEEGLNLHSGC